MKKPCEECPFSRSVKPGALGGSPAETYIGQSVLPFWLPCHCSAKYAGKASDVNEVQECHGAAIFRSNIGIAKKMPSGILTLPENRELVFATPAEFYAHHYGISVQEAEEILTFDKIGELVANEALSPTIRLQLKERRT